MSNLASYLPNAKGYPNLKDFVYNINNIYKKWLINYRAVLRVENKWKNITLNKNNVVDFIQDFCYAYKGRGPGIASRVINNNDHKKLAYCLNQARNYAYGSNSAVGMQIIINHIKDLNWSYGSKALRVLCPEKTIVFDDEMSKITGYPHSNNNTNSYIQYFKDCRKLQAIIQQKTKHPWRICDVEAALFQYLFLDN